MTDGYVWPNLYEEARGMAMGTFFGDVGEEGDTGSRNASSSHMRIHMMT
jgi:hypothetical protein